MDMASVTDVLDPAKDVLAGRVVVNLTNGTPAQARELAGRYDSDYLDGGIMAVPPTIGTPDAFVFYSGSRSAFDTNRAVLDLFGESRYVGDDAGLAALHDIALLSGMYGMFIGSLHALCPGHVGGHSGHHICAAAQALHRRDARLRRRRGRTDRQARLHDRRGLQHRHAVGRLRQSH